jgi:hypothetical protein
METQTCILCSSRAIMYCPAINLNYRLCLEHYNNSNEDNKSLCNKTKQEFKHKKASKKSYRKKVSKKSYRKKSSKKSLKKSL